MKIYANSDLSIFEQFLNTDIWVSARIKNNRYTIFESKYINILKVDKEYNVITFLQLDAELIDVFIIEQRPITYDERTEIDTALYLVQERNHITENKFAIDEYVSAFPGIVNFCGADAIEIYEPMEIMTSSEIQEMLDTCGEEPDNDFDDEDEDDDN